MVVASPLPGWSSQACLFWVFCRDIGQVCLLKYKATLLQVAQSIHLAAGNYSFQKHYLCSDEESVQADSKQAFLKCLVQLAGSWSLSSATEQIPLGSVGTLACSWPQRLREARLQGCPEGQVCRVLSLQSRTGLGQNPEVLIPSLGTLKQRHTAL